MNLNLAYYFIVDKEHNTITLKREFAAELPLVWDAYTKPEYLDQWWGPKPWNARTKHMDFREGGNWLYAMVGPNGEEHWSFANFKEIQLHKKYVGLDGFSDSEGNVNTAMPQSKWEVTFSEEGEKTLVTMHISFDTLDQLEGMIQMGFQEGITICLQQLDALLPILKK